MSLKYRILRIEYAIPFEDVTTQWRTKRESWIGKVVQSSGSAKQLAGKVTELLDALTPASIAYFWPDTSGFASLRDRIRPLATGQTADSNGDKLEVLVSELEKRTIPPPPAAEQRLMGKGKPLTFSIGDSGPELQPGDRCGALDIRMMWCKASVVGVRDVPEGGDPPGGQQYRIHYEGWKSRWDEWVDRESGRVAKEIPKKEMSK